uniref:Chorismate lyase n=1 Tax=Palmaria palmata TaxID=2822 RepID=A0A1C9CH88_PALPL|nr:hypothetical protein Palma_090 [Palmaria palmata]AOM67722.1 hypothetical protein Palma_090 [Palmaria palmata]
MMKIDTKLHKSAYTFIKIWSTNIENKKIFCSSFNDFIPKEWQLLLTSDGSLTRHINILRRKKVQIHIIINRRTVLENTKYFLLDRVSETKREVWLMNGNQTLIFAQSYWLEPKQSLQFNSHKPIGQVLIDNEINVHREITHIYCGYCEIIESKFGNKGPLWGRSYLLYFNRTPTLIINEIFSPYLVKDIQFFNHKTHA